MKADCSPSASALLSEPRALFDYIGALLLPRGPVLGVYTDDFATSHSLWDPVTTLPAILGLVALAIAAWLARKRMPAFFTGIGLFLAGHAMESTVFPLELYFEHRNYFPSVGIFLALAGLTGWCVSRIPIGEEGRSTRRLLNFGALALVAVLSVATLARASVWRYWPVLAAQGARQHPNSMRAQLDHASMLMAEKDFGAAQKVFEHLGEIDSPAARHVALIDTVFLQCVWHAKADPASIALIPSFAGAKLELSEMLSFEKLADYLHKHDCENLSKSYLATIIRDIVNAAPQPATLTQIWRSRFVAAQLYFHDGLTDEAIVQAAQAWMSGKADTAVGVYLARLYYSKGDFDSAKTILADVRTKIKPWDRRNLDAMAKLKSELAEVAPNIPAAAATVNSSSRQ